MISVEPDILSHHKLRDAGAAATCQYVGGLIYSAANLTDGFLPAECVADLAPMIRRPREMARKLVAVGLWEEVADGWLIHDYLDWQSSAGELTERRERRIEAGRKGGQASAQARASDGGGPRGGIPCPPTFPELETQEPSERLVAREAEGLGAIADQVEAVLRQCPRLHVDRMGIENAIAMYPAGDHVRAAQRTVAAVTGPRFASMPASELVNAASYLASVLDGQGQRVEDEKPWFEREETSA